MANFGYDDYVSQIKEDISTLRNIERVLMYLDNKRGQLVRAKYETNMALTDVSVDTENKVQEIKSYEAVKILRQYALRAIRDTQEFNIGEYRARLVAAIEDPRTIRIYYDSSTGEVRIRIRLDITAGDVHDYAKSIRKTRKQLKVGPYAKRPVPPEVASFMWMEKYYKPAREGTEIPQPKKKARLSKRKVRSDKKETRDYNTSEYVAKYKETMRLRLDNFGDALAPFWQIIDQGSTGLDSDYGGSGYPVIAPTRFVEKARKAISATLSRAFKRANYDIRDIKDKIAQIDRAISYIDNLTPKVVNRIAQLAERREGRISKSTFTVQEVRKALGDRFSQADMGKLFDLVSGLSTGEVDPNKRVSLTKAGGKRIQIRVKRLYAIVQEYRETH